METGDKIARIAAHFSEIMKILWLDLTDDSLEKTPLRVAKLYVNEWFSGLDPKNFPKMMTISNSMKYNQMLLERDIKVHSVCEHHFVPIVWVAHVAYIPNNRVVWLSKINRIVNYFSRRPQVQERLTENIHDSLVEMLETDNVAVVIDAKHFCVITRGVQDINSSTMTSKLSGLFLQQETKNEFLSAIKLNK